MAGWQEFEKAATKMLNREFGTNNIEFVSTGGSDSTQSDIQALKNGRLLFYIETKMSAAQSGQFVILDNGREFEFSGANKSDETEETSILIETINQNYDYYKNVGTASMRIDLDQEVFANWIIEHYQNNNVKYMLTEYNSSYVIFPVEKYREYFNIKADFRRKRSGSSDLPFNWELTVKRYLAGLYSDADIQYEGKKAYFYSSKNISDKRQYSIEGSTFQLNFVCRGKYLIRKLSTTSNPNIIFSISSRQSQQKCDKIAFVNEFK